MQVFSRDVMNQMAEPYNEGQQPGFVFNRVIGVHLDAIHELAREIDSDMDAAIGGVRWWATHPPGDRRQILISDHLLQCVMSIEKNLVDARLHQRALQHCTEVEERMLRHMVSARQMRDGVGFDVNHPRAQNARDDLPRTLGDLHRVGFFQSIGSALDCLGGAIVGVLGLATDLLRSDLGDARRVLGRHAASAATTPDVVFFRAFSTLLESHIRAAGPADWLEWSIDMRNMLMHRARRLQLSTIVPRFSGIIDEQGNPQMLTDSKMHLPRSPGHSDVEVFVATTFQPLLEEDANTTVGGVMDSVMQLMRHACAALARAWRYRRASPALILQPRRQWENTPRPASGFIGYAPGSRPFRVNSLHGNPSSVRRMQVALLMDGQRHRWASMP